MPKIVHNISVSGYRSTYCGSLGRLVLGTCGSYGIEQIQLTLEPDWAGLVVTANFVTSAGNTPVLVPESGLVDVPPEATAETAAADFQALLDALPPGQVKQLYKDETFAAILAKYGVYEQ